MQEYWSPTDLFVLFIDEYIVDMMTTQSVLYAQQHANHNFEITPDEMRCFIAILLHSGIAPLPCRRMYWENNPDMRSEAVSSAMCRNRFDEIMRYLHLADNTKVDRSDTFAKVRPLVRGLNDRLLAAFPVQQKLSIDESMIPYFGRHGAKQFIRGKPMRFGFKVWCLCTPLGYMVQFEPYQEAGQGGNNENDLGLGVSVVVDLISELPGRHM